MSRRKSVRQNARHAWYSVKTPHTPEEFADFSPKRGMDPLYFWAIPHAGAPHFLNTMKVCYGMENSKHFDDRFYHALEKQKSKTYDPRPQDRNVDFYYGPMLHNAGTVLQQANIHARLIISVRHPVDRIIEYYRQKHDDGKQYQSMTFYDFMESQMVDAEDNTMVRSIVEKPFPVNLQQEDVDQAVRFIANKAFLLRAEQPLSSIRKLERFLGIKKVSRETRQCVKSIMSKDMPFHDDESLQKFDLIQQRLEHHVKWDMILYQEMLAILERLDRKSVV